MTFIQRKKESCFIHSDDNLDSDSEHLNRCLTSIELSVSLMMLKIRYHLSHECINDILRLLRMCLIEVPSSYKSIKNLFRKRSGDAKPVPIVKYICPSCSSSSTSSVTCSSCFSSMTANDSPPFFFNFDLSSQIAKILCSSPDLHLVNQAKDQQTELCDIIDGEYYQRLFLAEQGNKFITLTMNVDGVSPNRGSTLSIWPLFLVINEIEKAKRFALENLIVGGIWPGPSKPSREQMFLFVADIVDQLKVLEKGKVFDMYSSCGPTTKLTLKVFNTFSKNSVRLFVFRYFLQQLAATNQHKVSSSGSPNQ